MRKFMTGLALAICALGSAPSAIVGTGAALAQAQPPGASCFPCLQQAPPTQPQTHHAVASQKAVEAVLGGLPLEAADNADPTFGGAREAVGKKSHWVKSADFNPVA